MRKILLSLLVVAIAVVIGIYLWNKPPETVENLTAIKKEPETLFQAFKTDEERANKEYLNKVVEVTGTVAEISNNQDGKTVITLSVSDPLSGVQCTMRDPKVNVVTGQTVTIKGFCFGYTLAVLLSDCIIL